MGRKDSRRWHFGKVHIMIIVLKERRSIYCLDIFSVVPVALKINQAEDLLCPNSTCKNK